MQKDETFIDDDDIDIGSFDDFDDFDDFDETNSNALIKLNSIPSEFSKEKKMSLIISSLFDVLFKDDKEKLNKMLKFLVSKNILENEILDSKYDEFKNNLSLLINSYNKKLPNNTINYLDNTYRNNYNQISMLGQGAFGTVYKVYHKLERKYYAIKKIFLTPDIINENVNLFNETHLYCNLDHKNIVKYHTSWIATDLQSIIEFNNIIDINDMDPINDTCQILFIQMELCDFTLDEYFLTQMLDDNIKKRILYFVDIINGLKYLHDNNIIHRDIKSNNIFFVENGNGEYDVKIGDFGLCKQQNNLIENNISNIIDIFDVNNNQCIEKKSNKKLLLMSSYIGTSYYRAPEAKNKKNITFSFDIYSLGIILLELILIYKTDFEKIKSIIDIKANPQHIKNIKNILTHNYDNIIIAMLNKNYNCRPSLDKLCNLFC
jgi:serine/threonine protein kinase